MNEDFMKNCCEFINESIEAQDHFRFLIDNVPRSKMWAQSMLGNHKPNGLHLPVEMARLYKNDKRKVILDGELTRQEILNKIVKHLREQNKKSVGNPCRYFTTWRDDYPKYFSKHPNFNEHVEKCPIGCLIDEKDYRSYMEHVGLFNWGSEHTGLYQALENSGVPADKDTLTFLSKFKKMHDELPVESWEEEMTKIALEYSLKMPDKKDKI